MARMGNQHQARLPIQIARIWIDAAREHISHDVGIAPPNGIFPTDIHSTDFPRANIFVFGTGGRIRQSPRKIDFSGLELERGF
jgi:hypothetical protein